MTRTLRKAMAYITRGDELLIFRHPDYPEAGLQVPAGTVEDGETPEAAVMREAFEETGLADLQLIGALGEQVRDMVEAGKGEIHHRYFFHLVTADPRGAWRWYESAGFHGGDPIKLDLFFVPLASVPPLITEHDLYVSRLLLRAGAP
jgi:8-oxo-dGTP diphosphatase